MRCPNCNMVSVEEPFCPKCHINLESDIVRTINKKIRVAWVIQALFATSLLIELLPFSWKYIPDPVFQGQSLPVIIVSYLFAYGIYKKMLTCALLASLAMTYCMYTSYTRHYLMECFLFLFIVYVLCAYFLYKYHRTIKASLSKQHLAFQRIKEGILAGVAMTLVHLLVLFFLHHQLSAYVAYVLLSLLCGALTWGISQGSKFCALIFLVLLAFEAWESYFQVPYAVILAVLLIQGTRGTIGYQKSLGANSAQELTSA